MPQISRNVPATPSTVAPTHSPSMAMPGWREPPRPSAATARHRSRPPTHSAPPPPHAPLTLKPDLLHGLAYALPVGWSGPGVVTIYDLSFLRFPDAFKPANRIYLTATTRATARRARRILTISEHARRDIVRLLSVPEQRVDVTYPAVEQRHQPLSEQHVESFRTARDLPWALVLALGP